MKEKINSNVRKIDEVEKFAAELQKTNSIFHQITVACLRWKQLNQGAHSRVEASLSRRKNTSIAIEEVSQGLIAFKIMAGGTYED